MNIFRDINSRGTTVVVATHDPTLIAENKRRVIVLAAGRGARDQRALLSDEGESEPGPSAELAGTRGGDPPSGRG
jgi:energy-coupling factor transporter ATP-binding protein EcfA2